ncbi:MAG TPA: MFS transporter [Bryobacteraceae bacterium]|nr:MFS transporter [Bryobacteraceae bacterium]
MRWWLIAPTLILFVIINQLDKTNISVLIANPQFLSDLHLTGQPARIGFLSSAFFYAYGASLVMWGFVVDRIGPRRSAIAGVVGWGLTTAWCATAGSVNEMYLARFALGLAEGCMWPVCNSYVGRWFAEREHGRIQAFWVNGNQIGVAIGLPIVTALLFAGGWRTVFWAFSAGSVLILLPMLLLLAPDEPSQSRFLNAAEQSFIATHRVGARRATSTVRFSRFSRVLRDERFWLIALCHACLVATFFGLTTWIPTYLTQVRGMAFSTMSASVALSYLLPIGLALVIGYVSDKTMRRAMVAAVCSVAMASMILAAVTVSNPIVSMLLLVISIAAPITYGATNTSLLHVLAPPDQAGRSTGICVGVANFLGAAGPTIIGYLIGRFSGRYLAAFAFISALNLAQACLYLRIAHLGKGAAIAS